MYFCVCDLSYFIHVHFIYAYNYILYFIKICTFDVMTIEIAVNNLLQDLMYNNCHLYYYFVFARYLSLDILLIIRDY